LCLPVGDFPSFNDGDLEEDFYILESELGSSLNLKTFLII